MRLRQIALVGKDLAAKNGLSAGSTFTAYGQTITVAGPYVVGSAVAVGISGVAVAGGVATLPYVGVAVTIK